MKIDQREKVGVTLPASHQIETCYLMDQKRNTFDHRVVFQHFINEGRLKKDQIEKIITLSSEILSSEPNLLRIDKNSFIIGDIHGQLYDLKNIIDKFDLNSHTLVFLGDYVDRGTFSLECYVYLLLLKIEFPKNIFLLRGNHESFSMTSHFTFMNEVVTKYDNDLYYMFMESFKTLPVAAVIEKKAFCCHGGISPLLKKLEEINNFDRFCEIPTSGLFCDLMWADPHPKFNQPGYRTFSANVSRNCSYFYGYQAVEQFLQENKLITIFRGHEVQKEGYKKYKEYQPGIPSVHTIFSAPNYCDVYKNTGAIAYFNGQSVKILTFEAKPHPYCNKNFIDIINQTIPFISEKISEFYLDILKYLSNKELSEGSTTTITEPEEIIDEIKETEEFTTNMVMMRIERENIDEVSDSDQLTLSAEKCLTIDEKDISYEKAHDLDEKNEELKERKEDVRGLSIAISPSLIPVATKSWDVKGVENMLENVTLEVGEKTVKIEEKND